LRRPIRADCGCSPATDPDEGSTERILEDADRRDEEASDAEYGEADSEHHPDA
jgi:hypothetical protein